jgi:hypothetical protein
MSRTENVAPQTKCQIVRITHITVPSPGATLLFHVTCVETVWLFDRLAGGQNCSSRPTLLRGTLLLFAAAKPKSDLYRDLLPAINSRMVDLLEDERLFAQIVGLERRTARGGRDSIDHAPGAHDDVANAVAGVIAALASSAHGYDSSMEWVNGPDRRSKAHSLEGDNRSMGGQSNEPSLHNLSWRRSFDSIFDEV